MPQNNTDPINLRILFAEDNVINQKITLAMLEKQGWDVTMVTDGQQLVTEFSKGKYDIILSDIQMPVFNGYEAAKCIREAEGDCENPIPIIAMTGVSSMTEKYLCIEAGMDAVISKPVQLEELMKILHSLLGSSMESEPGRIQAKSGSCNLERVLENLSGKKEILQDLIRIFLQTYPKDVKNLEDSIRQKDAAKTERDAHYLKGALASIGAERPAELAGEIGKHGSQGRFLETEDQMKEFKQELQSLEAYLSQPDCLDKL